MPWSDEERLERVYRRASSIKTARRVRVLSAAIPVLLIAGAVVAATGSPGNDGRELVQADGTTTTTTGVVDLTVPSVDSTVVPLDTSLPPVETTLPKPPKPALRPTTTSTTEPWAPNCGGFVRAGYKAPAPPEGMVMAVEASKKTVRRGEEVVLTVRARWTGSEPFTHQGSRDWQLVFAHLSGPIHYSSQYHESYRGQGNGEETWQPGEEKTHSFPWKTSQSCGPYGMSDAKLRPGTYTVEGHWNSNSNDQGLWEADPVTFELVD